MLLLSGCLAIGSRAVWAQALLDELITRDVAGVAAEPGVTVASRERSEYSSLGVRVGNFMIRPELTESVGYTDNATATRDGRGSALIATSAALRAQSNWSRHRLNAAVTVDDQRFLQESAQSFTNWSASIDGAYDIGRDTVTASYSHQNLTQTVRDLDVPQLDESLAFRVDTGVVSYRATFNRLFAQPTLSVASYNFDNGTAGGVVYEQSYRNRVVVTPSITLGYELAPRRNLVLVVRNAHGLYTDRPEDMVSRDFSDVAVLAGVDYDALALLRFRVLAGYQNRSFRSDRYKTIQAPVVEATAIWTPTTLVSLTGTVGRRVQDSADDATAAFTETAVRFVADYEYTRNVLFQGRAELRSGDYSGSSGSQLLYRVGAGATVLLNRNMRLGANYDFTGRRSNGNGNLGMFQNQQFGSSYSENRFLLQLRLFL
ncbi:outer membrane beta-barrel protein [Roseomonas sp. BN140053]|uniref:outer membrane beta-barrel protein n=1 Tax=Roseomonas sp. BN140053 TaxID=3391898 RepID=UPI0039EB0BF3